MLFVLPTPLVLSELDSALPCSEEEWSADTTEKWWTLRTGNAPPTPSFQEAFTQLFEDSCDRKVLYSECGSYIMISAILSAIFDAHRLSYLPSGTVNFEKFDVALNNWQRLWLAEPKSLCTGRSTPIGALAFNASAVYRAASVMRVRDYTRYSFLLVACLIFRITSLIHFSDEKTCCDRILEMVKEENLEQGPGMIRALVCACVSIQTPVKLGVRFVMQTAALTWSLDQLFCNFEVGIPPFYFLYLTVRAISTAVASSCGAWWSYHGRGATVFDDPSRFALRSISFDQGKIIERAFPQNNIRR